MTIGIQKRKISILVISGFVLMNINGVLFKVNITPEWVTAIIFYISTMLIIYGLFLYRKKIQKDKKGLYRFINLIIGFVVIMLIVGAIVRIFS